MPRAGLSYKGKALSSYNLSVCFADSSPSRGASGETVHFAGTAKASPTRGNGDDRRQWRKQEEAVGAAASGMRAAAKQTLGAATRAPSCHIRIASAFIQKHKVTCLESRYKAVPVFSLLRHIGNAPVHWHEETFSSGGILLSDENATVFLTSSDLQPVAPTQIATLNATAAICFFFDRIKIFQASIPQAERISYTVLFHALPV